MVAVFGVQRRLDRVPFGHGDAETLRPLMPHLGQAARVHRRVVELEARVEALESVYDRWQIGVILSDSEGVVEWCNRLAEGILRDRDGLCTHRQRLTADHPRANRELRELLRRAAGDGGGTAIGGGTSVPRRSIADEYLVLVAPLSPRAAEASRRLGRSLAVVLLCDPSRAVRVPADALRRLYRLTPAEARLAEAILAGRRVRDAAGLLEISESTARSYLKRVLRKTGTHCQADLMRTVISGVAPLAACGDGAAQGGTEG
jgi:DNA-binding CsgD family transcriptional regulator